MIRVFRKRGGAPRIEKFVTTPVVRELPRTGSLSYNSRPYAGIAQLVERNLAKVEVGSSRLLSRSRFERTACLSVFGCSAYPCRLACPKRLARKPF